MRRAVPISLSPDEHCAVHHFIRVHGRRPTPEELRQQVQTYLGGVPAPAGPSTAVASGLRRRLARALSRL
jgi:hypothetical protein